MHKNLPFYLLCLVFLIYSTIHYIVIMHDTSPFLYDSAGYFRSSLIAYHILNSGINGNTFRAMLCFWCGGTWHFPPVAMLSSVPFYFLFGPTQDSAQMSNLIFLAGMVFSVYFIGKILQDKIAGFMASCLLLTFPMIIGHSRLYWLYFPTTCWVAFSVCILLYSNHFRNKLFSILFGASIGIGCLIRQPFPVTILGPFLFIAYQSLREKPNTTAATNILIAIGIATIVALSWYLPNLRLTREYFSWAITDSSYGKGVLSFSLQRLIFHLHALKEIMLHQFYFYLFISCFIFFARLRKKRDELVLLFWLICPYLFFMLVRTPLLHQYTMPVLPAVALIISVAIGKINKTSVKKLVYTVAITIGILQAAYFYLSPGRYTGLSYYLNNFEMEGLIKPDNHDWQIEKLASFVSKDSGFRPIKLVFLPDIAPVSGGLRYQPSLINDKVELILPTLTPIYDYHDKMELYKKMISQKKFIMQFDYVILLDDESDTSDFWRTQSAEEKELFRILKKNFKSNIDEFTLVQKMVLPYNIGIVIYKR